MKKTIFKKILLILFIVLVAIQFIHPAKNQSTEMPATHIYNKYATSQDVQQILATACNDCHTNNTNYPWYASIQPVDWWLNDVARDLSLKVYWAEPTIVTQGSQIGLFSRSI